MSVSVIKAIGFVKPTTPARIGRAMNCLATIPSVQLIHHVLGEHPIICTIKCANVNEFRRTIDSIRRFPWISSIDSRLLATHPDPFWGVILEDHSAWVLMATPVGNRCSIIANLRNTQGVVGARTLDSGPDDVVALVQFRNLSELKRLAQIAARLGVTRFRTSIVVHPY